MFTSSSLSLLLYVVESLLSLTEISRSITMGKCTFNELWLEDGAFSYWLKPVANNRYQAYCTLCKKALELSSLGIKSLQSHAKSESYKVAVKGLQRVQVLFGSVTNVTRSKHSAGYRLSRIQCHTQWFRINLHTESGDPVGVEYRDCRTRGTKILPNLSEQCSQTQT